MKSFAVTPDLEILPPTAKATGKKSSSNGILSRIGRKKNKVGSLTVSRPLDTATGNVVSSPRPKATKLKPMISPGTSDTGKGLSTLDVSISSSPKSPKQKAAKTQPAVTPSTDLDEEQDDRPLSRKDQKKVLLNLKNTQESALGHLASLGDMPLLPLGPAAVA